MGVFDELITIDNNGEIKINQWIEWKHISTGIAHCPTCLALDKCWFNNSLKPQLPQHEKCHCTTTQISKPLADVNALATCDISKFKDYIFADKYAWNGKRDLFERLGYTINDSEYLQKEYIDQAIKNYCDSKYTLDKLDNQGQRINIDIELIRNGRKIIFSSGWMVRPKGSITNNTPLAN